MPVSQELTGIFLGTLAGRDLILRRQLRGRRETCTKALACVGSQARCLGKAGGYSARSNTAIDSTWAVCGNILIAPAWVQR